MIFPLSHSTPLDFYYLTFSSFWFLFVVFDGGEGVYEIRGFEMWYGRIGR